jgi:hypothetical protein
MKTHLVWIRVTAAAAIVAGVGLHPAAAQYAPYRPIPPKQPAAPAAPAAPAPSVPYVAYRPQAPYQAPVAQYQAPVAQYQAPVATYPQTAATYPTYPQTTAQYPAAPGANYYVANNQPTEAQLPPPQSAGPGPGNGQVVPGHEMTAMPADSAAAVSGYPAGGYHGASGYAAAGCGYGDVSGCMEDCGPENQWFGGVYFLLMDRDDPSPVQLAVEVPVGATYPYYPPRSVTVVNSAQADYDYRAGVEVRFGSTFTIGDSCDTCQSGCGGGYTGYGGGGCGCGCPPTTYAWEVAWWGLDDDAQEYVFEDNVTTRVYGMKSFAGLQTDRDSDGSYVPVNTYYDYQIPINTPGGGDTLVLAQRVWSNFRAQNLEINIIRFPLTCDTCGSGCGGCNAGCGYDASGCGSNYTGCNSGCEEDCCGSNFSMYGSCGVRYFRIDDDFSYDTEFDVPGDGHVYDGFSGVPDLNELCYDVNIENNLIGPQVGWTSNYCIGCRWNFFCNSTFGIFDNHMTNYQRVWGSGPVVFTNTGETMTVSSNKDDVAFLGELRVGGSYDFTCNWRGVLAYRAVGLSGVATTIGNIPTEFSDRADVANINSDNSMIIHGVQTGVECRY